MINLTIFPSQSKIIGRELMHYRYTNYKYTYINTYIVILKQQREQCNQLPAGPERMLESLQKFKGLFIFTFIACIYHTRCAH